MASFTPADWIELVKAVFVGVATICMPLATVYVMVGAARSKRNAESIREVSLNVDRLEKNTNSISERNQAIAQKLGITEGIAQERASVKANANKPLAPLPLPVTDDSVVDKLDDVVKAIEKSNGDKEK